jgi:hypothetical protein
MNIYLIRRIGLLLAPWHSGGGVVVFAPDEKTARQLIADTFQPYDGSWLDPGITACHHVGVAVNGFSKVIPAWETCPVLSATVK